MGETVFLFDLDGVLVQPGGYRAALRAAANYFFSQMGLGAVAPDDETVAIFEAQGITCEWDMLPITLAIGLEAFLAQQARQGLAELPRLDTLDDACRWCQANTLSSFQVDYPPVMRSLGQFLAAGEAAADSLLAACETGQGAALWPILAGQGVLRELLAHSRYPDRSLTTHVFETFVLGDAAYSNAVGLPAPFPATSYLASLDEPFLLPELRDRLLALREAGKLHISAYTARPSMPVVPTQERLAVFVPEAEMALSLVGFEAIPLVGSGQTGELGARLGQPPDRLTKPSPYHAIAAVAAACTRDRALALDWTSEVFRHFENGGARLQSERLARGLPSRLHLHVFEDSPGGMIGGQEAARLLSQLGIQVDLSLWGVSSHPDKVQALRNTGARVFETVNLAIAEALSSDSAGDFKTTRVS